MREAQELKPDQPMVSVIEELADAAEATAHDQQRLARRARDMIRLRRRGWAWSKIVENEKPPGAIALLRSSAKRLAVAGGLFRQTLAQVLAREGLSTRKIARHFGVTHQRVSVMVNTRNQ